MKKLASTVALTLLPSCATIITGTTDDIVVTSNPPGAFVRTNVGQGGRTPTTLSVPDDQPLSLHVRMSGYQEQSVTVGTRYSAWLVGNVVFGGLIGLVVDLAGGGHVHGSDQVHVDLVPVPPGRRPVAEDRPRRRGESFEEWTSRKQADASP